ncbi:MAG: hypothetical protein Q8L22_20535 [Reyranella sp.]|nr:hypothetical protein [Reyranella sp.]
MAYDDGRHATVAANGLMPAGFPFSTGFRALAEGGAIGIGAAHSEPGGLAPQGGSLMLTTIEMPRGAGKCHKA